LKQLPKTGNEETAKSSQNVTSRTLACHVFDLMNVCAIDKSISRQIGSAESAVPLHPLTGENASGTVARIYVEVR